MPSFMGGSISAHKKTAKKGPRNGGLPQNADVSEKPEVATAVDSQPEPVAAVEQESVPVFEIETAPAPEVIETLPAPEPVVDPAPAPVKKKR